jgi:hypothetical protein
MPLGEWGWETVQQSPPIGIAVALGGGALLSVAWEATVRSGLLSMGGTDGVGVSLTAILVAVQWLVIGTLLGCVGTLSGLYWVARQTGVTKVPILPSAEGTALQWSSPLTFPFRRAMSLPLPAVPATRVLVGGVRGCSL